MKVDVTVARDRRLAFAGVLAAICLICLAAAVVGARCWPEVACVWILGGLCTGAAALFIVGVPAVLARASATPAVDIVVLDAIDALPDEWEEVVAHDNPYLRRQYLGAIIETAPSHLHLRYALARRGGRPIAALCVHVVDVDPDALGEDVGRWRLPLRLLLGWLRLTRPGPLRLLISGSALHPRTQAFQAASSLSERESAALHAQLIAEVQRRERARGPITLAVIKDLSPGHAERDAVLEASGYAPLDSAQPTMLVELDPRWRTADDYLAAMTSKYRKRARGARRKGGALTRRTLDSAEIEANATELQRLVDSVMARAVFKLSSPSISMLAGLRRHLGDGFELTAYADGERLVGFTAALVHGARLEALLVGLDYSINQERALYQNMLYDFVERAIERECRTVHLGRTALEIKSTVGAEPEQLRIFLRHPNTVLNWLMRVALSRAASTPAQWTPRHPFKPRIQDAESPPDPSPRPDAPAEPPG